MPPGLRRKSIAVGILEAITIASWPAPLVMVFTGKPAASIASVRNAVRPLVHRHGGLVKQLCLFKRNSARAAIAAALASNSSTAATRMVSFASRTSRLTCTAPGTTLAAFGSTLIFSHSGHQSISALCQRLHCRDQLSGGSQRIVTQTHWRGSCVIGLS